MRPLFFLSFSFFFFRRTRAPPDGMAILRVHTPDADIDVLCLAPRHCSRDAFFTSFCEMLGNHPEIDELFPVPEAYTPVSFFPMNASGVGRCGCGGIGVWR